jgi:REP element-mobilizing transposase RayT
LGRRKKSLALRCTPGGARPGAGRPTIKHRRASERHQTRPFLAARCPVQVTLRIARNVASLRTRHMIRALRWASLTAARHADTFRIIHVSVQRDHVHLVVEAHNRMKLARGMQSFEISAARLLNRVTRRRGVVFPDRYHARILRTPSEVRNAVAYVLLNWRHHKHTSTGRLDPFSTAFSFPHWRELDHSPLLFKPPPTYEPLVHYLPRTWLLRNAFRRARRPSIFDVP